MGKNEAISAVCNKNAHPKTIRFGVPRAAQRGKVRLTSLKSERYPFDSQTNVFFRCSGVNSSAAVSDFCDIEGGIIADLLLVDFADGFDKGVNALVLYQADGAAAKAGAGHTGA